MGDRDHDSRRPRLGGHFALGRGGELGAERWLPDRFFCRHYRDQLLARPHPRSHGGAPAGGGARVAGEDRILGQHESRGPHADERGPRPQRPAARHRARRQAGEDGHGDSRVRGRPHRHRRRGPGLLAATEGSGGARAGAIRHERPHRRCGGPHAAARCSQGAPTRVRDEGVHESTTHRR